MDDFSIYCNQIVKNAKIVSPKVFSTTTDERPWNSRGFTSIILNQRNVSFNPSKDNVAKMIDRNNTNNGG